MNDFRGAYALAIVCSLIASGCHLSHGLDVDGDDSGVPFDSGAVDSGAVDSGAFDSGVRFDSGARFDAGPIHDSGTDALVRFDAGLDSGTPPPGVRAVQLAVGRHHVCALGDDGLVYCWGDNETGQLTGTERRQVVPAQVRGLPPIASVHTMDVHTCAVDEEGGVWCWGFNFDAQLGTPQTELPDCGHSVACSRVPLRVDVSQMSQVYVAHRATCARDTRGEVRCWGNEIVREVPTDEVRSGSTIDFGLVHGCALTAAGIVRCFGETSFGRTGPRADGVINLPDVAELEVGTGHSCVLTEANEVLCWGSDEQGSLGVPDLPYCRHRDTAAICSVLPLAPVGVPPSRALSVGGQRSCVITVAGAVGCWGAWTSPRGASWCGSESGECDTTYEEVSGIGDVVALDVGGSVACVINDEGAVHCWGWNDEGQLGNGLVDEALSGAPVRVVGFGE